MRSRLGRHPGLDALQELDPVRDRPPAIGVGEGLARGRLERAEDVAFAPSAVVDLLDGALDGTGRGIGVASDDLLAREALGRLRPHLVQADHDTLLEVARCRG